MKLSTTVQIDIEIDDKDTSLCDLGCEHLHDMGGYGQCSQTGEDLDYDITNKPVRGELIHLEDCSWRRTDWCMSKFGRGGTK